MCHFEDCYMNKRFLMEKCFGTLVHPVFLYKRIQGLIRKTAQLVVHWAYPAWKCMSTPTLILVQGQEMSTSCGSISLGEAGRELLLGIKTTGLCQMTAQPAQSMWL